MFRQRDVAGADGVVEAEGDGDILDQDAAVRKTAQGEAGA